MKTVGVIALLALIGYAAVCAAMYVGQRSLLYFPQPRAVDEPGSTLNLPVEGAEIVVTTRSVDSPKAIVYFGGNGEDVSWNLAPYTRAFPDHALYFMHYRGYGGSTGQPTEAANVADALALLDKVRARHTDVTLVGRSLGSGVAVQVAAQAAASRLVLITPFDSIVEIGAQAYPFVPVRWLALDTYDSGRFAPRIGIPTALIAAEHDEIIPRASTEQLLRRFPAGVATMTVIDGVGHNDLERNPAYMQALDAAVR